MYKRFRRYHSLQLCLYATAVTALLLAACEDNPVQPAPERKWRPQSIGVDFSDVHMFDEKTGVAVGRYGAVYSIENGLPRSSLGAVAGGEDLTGVWGRSRNDFWTIAWTGRIDHYHDGVWSAGPSQTARLNDVWGDDAGNVLVVGTGGLILRFDGAAWHQESPGTDADFLQVHSAPGGYVFAAGTDGTVVRWDGASWTDLDFPITGDVTALWAFANDDVYAVAYGALSVYDGNQWSVQVPPFVGMSAHMCGTPEGDVFVVNDETVTYRIGGEWHQSELTDRYRRLQAVSGVSSGSVVTVGNYGVVAGFDGAAWTVSKQASTIEYIQDLHGIGGEVWAAGWGAGPGHYDRTSWQWADPPFNTPQDALYTVWVDPAGTVWAAGRELTPVDGTGVIARLDGDTWTPVFNPQTRVNDIWGTSPTDICAVGNDGLLVRFDGENWTETVTLDGTTDLKSIWGIEVESSPENHSEYYAVGQGEMIFVSGDYWNERASYLGFYKNAIFGVSSGWFMAVGVAGKVITGPNGWQYIPIPEEVDLYGVWALSTDDAYVAGDGGTIYHWDGDEWERMVTRTHTQLTSVFGYTKERVFAAGVNGTVLVLDL